VTKSRSPRAATLAFSPLRRPRQRFELAWVAACAALAAAPARTEAAAKQMRISPAADSSKAEPEPDADEALGPASPSAAGTTGPRRAVTLDDRGGDSQDGSSDTGTPPSTHVVKKGDTLWDICARYFRDPWRWPKVWALNPEIENPHWIFPGQLVRLDKDDPSRGVVVAAPSADESSPATAPPSRAVVLPASPGLKEVGFVDEGGLRLAGTIAGSPEEKIMLASGDAAYVSYAEKQKLIPGREYPVYEVDASHPVRDPESQKTLGFLVHVRGYARMEEVRDNQPLAQARLIETTDPIERGFRVGDVFHDRLAVTPCPARKAVAGRVVAALSPNLLIGREAFVVLNRGRADGVLSGNLFRVIRRGDGYRDVMEHWEGNDPSFPPLVVGDVLAVDVREHTTIGWVSRAAVELRVGDAVSLTAGE